MRRHEGDNFRPTLVIVSSRTQYPRCNVHSSDRGARREGATPRELRAAATLIKSEKGWF